MWWAQWLNLQPGQGVKSPWQVLARMTQGHAMRFLWTGLQTVIKTMFPCSAAA